MDTAALPRGLSATEGFLATNFVVAAGPFWQDAGAATGAAAAVAASDGAGVARFFGAMAAPGQQGAPAKVTNRLGKMNEAE